MSIDMSKIKIDMLNDTYYRIAELIGIENTVRLSEVLAGQQISITKIYDIDNDYNEIVDCIGKPNTVKIIKAFSGERVYFGSMKNALKKQLYEEIHRNFTGYNYKELSAKYGYCQRHIRQILSVK